MASSSSATGLTFSVQAVPVRADDDTVESAARRRPRRHASAPRAEQQIARQRTPAERRRRRSAASRSRATTSARLMAEAVTTATATLGVDVGRVLELDEDGRALTIVAAVGLPDGMVGAHRSPLSESANAGHTLRTGEPTIVEDMAAETRFKPSPTLLKLGVVSSLSVADRGPRPAVRGPQRRHARAAWVLRGRGRVPHRDRDADHRRRRAPPRRAGDAPRRAARPAHRTCRTARSRSTGSRRRWPAGSASASTSRSSCSTSTASSSINDSSRPRRRRRGAARAGAPADRRGAHDRHGRAARRRRVRRHLPRRRRRRAAPRTSPSGSRAAVTRPLVLDSGEHFFTVSIGGTLGRRPSTTRRSRCCGDADAAMYRAKARGRGGYELFDEAMRTEPDRARAHRDRAAPRARPTASSRSTTSR